MTEQLCALPNSGVRAWQGSTSVHAYRILHELHLIVPCQLHALWCMYCHVRPYARPAHGGPHTSRMYELSGNCYVAWAFAVIVSLRLCIIYNLFTLCMACCMLLYTYILKWHAVTLNPCVVCGSTLAYMCVCMTIDSHLSISTLIVSLL